jgi:flagellar export protein FliJ
VKRYRFRLESVLGVRRAEEEKARGQLVAANAAVTAQEQLLAERDRAYQISLKSSGMRPCADFLFEQSSRSAHAAAVVEQRRRVREAYDDAARARGVWMGAAARVGALERLDERQRNEHRAAALKEDELTTDELVVSRYARSDR